MEFCVGLGECWIGSLAFVTVLHKVSDVGVHVSPKESAANLFNGFVPSQVTSCESALV